MEFVISHINLLLITSIFIDKSDIKMTAKSAIIDYLRNHDRFKANDIIETYGYSKSLVSSATQSLIREGFVTKRKDHHGSVIFISTYGNTPLDSYETIFDECRNSPYMKRILMFYGRK